MTPKLHRLWNQIGQAISACTTCSATPTWTVPPTHTSPIAHTASPITHTTSPIARIQQAEQVEEAPVQGTSASFREHDRAQQVQPSPITRIQQAEQVEEAPVQGTSASFRELDHIQQIQHLHTCITELQTENTTLHTRIHELNTRCTTLANELESVRADLAVVRAAQAAQPPHRSIARGWHQRANAIIGAQHSRSAPSHAYKCAHDGCTWRNKKVTLQAYVLHLKRNHGQNISNNPNTDLLPVLSSE